ncbi:hypothetical protein C8R45DRAFT_928021 [Mycena sanguinolenta]|nr:hypothetical protein C8R45DRAFT_928021 [Mycena sanguinolenta]
MLASIRWGGRYRATNDDDMRLRHPLGMTGSWLTKILKGAKATFVYLCSSQSGRTMRRQSTKATAFMSSKRLYELGDYMLSGGVKRISCWMRICLPPVTAGENFSKKSGLQATFCIDYLVHAGEEVPSDDDVRLPNSRDVQPDFSFGARRFECNRPAQQQLGQQFSFGATPLGSEGAGGGTGFSFDNTSMSSGGVKPPLPPGLLFVPTMQLAYVVEEVDIAIGQNINICVRRPKAQARMEVKTDTIQQIKMKINSKSADEACRREESNLHFLQAYYHGSSACWGGRHRATTMYKYPCLASILLPQSRKELQAPNQGGVEPPLPPDGSSACWGGRYRDDDDEDIRNVVAVVLTYFTRGVELTLQRGTRFRPLEEKPPIAQKQLQPKSNTN